LEHWHDQATPFSDISAEFQCTIWMTFNQNKQLCTNVRKGALGYLLVFANIMNNTVTEKNGDEVDE